MRKLITILIAIILFAMNINLFAQEKNNANINAKRMDAGTINIPKTQDGPKVVNTFTGGGGANGYWGTDRSWSLGHYPTAAEDAVINANCGMNMISGVCNSLTINSGKTLTMWGTSVLTVSGNVANNGTIIFNSGNSTTATWLFVGGDFTNSLGAIFTETAAYCRFSFNGTGTQTFTNNGTITAPMSDLSVNSGGLTIVSTNNIIVTRVNSFWGTITNSNKITLGTGGTSYAVIQRGVQTSTSPVGNFDVSPTFNVGSEGLNLVYDYASADYTIDKEVPASGNIYYMIFYPTIARTITLAKNVTVTGTGSALEFNSANVSKFALGANNLTIDPSGTIIGASAGDYVVTNGAGQLKRTVSNNDTYVFFPVGLSAYNPLNIKLNAASATDIFGVKVNDAISNPGYVAIKTVNRQWDISKATSNATNATIQFQFNSGEGLTDYLTGEIGHWNGSFYDQISAGITGTGPYVVTNIQLINSFSPFIIGNAGAMPVELASFNANVISRDVKINWTTATETNNSGFEIMRSGQNENGSWNKVGYVTGNGTKTTPTNYSFEDKKLYTGKYNYRLKQIDYNGNFEYFNLAGVVEIGVPDKFNISQNYPNPFNPTTKIDFDLPYESKVSIKLYEMSGREVLTLVNEQKSAGYYTVQMNASNLSSGVYFYRINAGNFTAVKKMLMIK